jgi:hypothetical protein
MQMAVPCNPPVTTADAPSLVSDSLFPASSSKVTRTLMTLPLSDDWRVSVEPVVPSISVSSASHW